MNRRARAAKRPIPAPKQPAKKRAPESLFVLASACDADRELENRRRAELARELEIARQAEVAFGQKLDEVLRQQAARDLEAARQQEEWKRQQEETAKALQDLLNAQRLEMERMREELQQNRERLALEAERTRLEKEELERQRAEIKQLREEFESKRNEAPLPRPLLDSSLPLEPIFDFGEVAPIAVPQAASVTREDAQRSGSDTLWGQNPLIRLPRAIDSTPAGPVRVDAASLADAIERSIAPPVVAPVTPKKRSKPRNDAKSKNEAKERSIQYRNRVAKFLSLFEEAFRDKDLVEVAYIEPLDGRPLVLSKDGKISDRWFRNMDAHDYFKRLPTSEKNCWWTRLHYKNKRLVI